MTARDQAGEKPVDGTVGRRGRTLGYWLECGHLLVCGCPHSEGEFAWCGVCGAWELVEWLEWLELFDGPPWGKLH